jgi:hypothetical protein
MRTLSALILSVGLLAAATTPLAAQRRAARAPARAAAPAHRVRWGPQISLNSDGSSVAVGARLEHSLAGLLGKPKIYGNAEGNWYPGTVNLFDLTYSVVYRFTSPKLRPYAGGGLAWWIATGSGAPPNNLHLNAVGGLQFEPMGRVTPILQLRYVFVKGDALVLTAGLLF